MEIKLNFKKMQGLMPVVIQDIENNEILMIGFMDEEAWQLTLQTGKVHYWSRKRKRIWMKGEHSKHYQIVKEVYTDNDYDSILIKVKQVGGAVEDGYRSCFYYKLEKGDWYNCGEKVFEPKEIYSYYNEKVKFLIPNGSLYSMTIVLLGLSGYQLNLQKNKYNNPSIRNFDNIEIEVVEANKIAEKIEQGDGDIGLVGLDLIKNSKSKLTLLSNMEYNELGLGSINWVLAAKKNIANELSNINNFQQKHIYTEIPNIVKEYFNEKDVIVFTTKDKNYFDKDVIVDICETGNTLIDNDFIILDSVFTSTTHLIANNDSYAQGWKRKTIESIEMNLLQGIKKLPQNPKKFLKIEKRI